MHIPVLSINALGSTGIINALVTRSSTTNQAMKSGNSRGPDKTNATWLLAILLCAAFTSGCSIKKIAINKLGDALAGGGTTFSADDDPELVKAAVPFSLKLMESLLAENPNHKGLLLATASGFTQYGYAFVQQEADELE